jgi:hypothetical protein
MIKTGLGLKAKAWWLARRLLPMPLVYHLWHLKTRRAPRPELDTATDGRQFRPQPDVMLEVFWARVPGVGGGPAASLFVLGEEILRMDCFGGAIGHMHFNPEQARLTTGWEEPRIYFGPGTIPDHIARGVFELKTNGVAALKSNKIKRIHDFPLDTAALDRVGNDMADYMQALYETHGDDPGSGDSAASP